MKSVLLCASALAVLLAADIAAQPPASHANDPRVGLKAGLRNAGVAARNLELVASLPKPAGFFDPAAPAGSAIPPPVDDKLPATDPAVVASRAAMTKILSFSTSDLAFDGKYAVLGSFHGFNT